MKSKYNKKILILSTLSVIFNERYINMWLQSKNDMYVGMCRWTYAFTVKEHIWKMQSSRVVYHAYVDLYMPRVTVNDKPHIWLDESFNVSLLNDTRSYHFCRYRISTILLLNPVCFNPRLIWMTILFNRYRNYDSAIFILWYLKFWRPEY